jgi:hypothetical protein
VINSTISELVNVFGIQMQELENRNDHEISTVCFCSVVEPPLDISFILPHSFVNCYKLFQLADEKPELKGTLIEKK